MAMRLKINPNSVPPALSSPPSTSKRVYNVRGEPPMVRISANSCRRARMLSNTEMKMLAKLRAMMSMAMARSAFVPSPNCWVMRFTSIAGRATCMLVSRNVLGMVKTASGLRFLSSMAVISRLLGSTSFSSWAWTSQMLWMAVKMSWSTTVPLGSMTPTTVKVRLVWMSVWSVNPWALKKVSPRASPVASATFAPSVTSKVSAHHDPSASFAP